MKRVLVWVGIAGATFLLASCLLIRGKVSGQVLIEQPDGSTMPIPAITVELVDANGNRLDTAISDPNGNFDFERRVPAGTYKCRTVAGGALGSGMPMAESTVKVFKSRVKCQLILRFPSTQ